MAVFEPELVARQEKRTVLGTVVIGTVEGDIHEIGKSLVATMLSAAGFEVRDLGVDVAASVFI
jgi:methanogenic corrinoid protein MtbC1